MTHFKLIGNFKEKFFNSPECMFKRMMFASLCNLSLYCYLPVGLDHGVRCEKNTFSLYPYFGSAKHFSLYSLEAFLRATYLWTKDD